MSDIKLLQMFTQRQLSYFIKENFSVDLTSLSLHELTEDPFFGDFIIIGEYKFKKIYSQYQCMQTPTQKYEVKQLAYYKAKNDIYKKH